MRKMIFIIILIIMCVTGSVFGQYTPAVSSMHTAEAVVGRPSTYDESQNIVQILGDKIVLQISLGSADLVTNVSLFYRTPGMSAYQMTNFLPKPTGGATYAGSATIPPAHVELGNTGIYIVAYDSTGLEDNVYGSSNTPQLISVSQNNSANIGTGGGTITLRDGNPQDGEVKLTIPSGALNETRTITLKQIYPAPGDDKYKDTVAVYQIEPENIVFKSVSDLELLYFDLDNNGLVDSSGIQENDLTIFWHDGFEWREASGSIDTIKNVVKGNIIKSGIFGVMVQTAGAAEDIKPREKIATPNGDGVNDFLYFNGLTGQYKITIIDVNGRLINTISDVPYWDGRDENGNIVPSGIYLYEVKYNGKSVKGICAIAK